MRRIDLAAIWRWLRSEGELSRFHAQESGMITIVSVVVLFFLILFSNLVWNVGATVNIKMETQNGADAAAYSTSLWMARGLNAVTATNHLLGEMMAFVVIRSSLGEMHDKRKKHSDFPTPAPTRPKAIFGDAADQKDRFQQAAQLLKTAYQLADAAKAQLGSFFTAYDYIKDTNEVKGSNIDVGSTISDSRYYLMKALTLSYGIEAVAGILEKIPFLQAIGYALDAASLAMEIDIYVEWKVIDVFEKVYDTTEILTTAIIQVGLPAARDYVTGEIADLPMKTAMPAGKKIAQDNGCTGGIFPNTADKLKYFFEDDPGGLRGRSDSNNEDMRKSQFVRATYPWVRYHRRPIVDVFNFLKFSQAAYHFVYWTNDYTLLKCRDIYKDKSCFLKVLAGSSNDNKGSESWVNDSRDLERRFAIVGMAHRKSPRYASSAILGSPNPNGVAAYAMALVYNANASQPSSGTQFQPNWGWDTLNWELPTRNSDILELPDHPCPDRNGHHADSPRPQIKLNWQTKLTPASSYLTQAVNGTSGPFQNLLKPLVPLDSVFKNH